MKITNTFHRKYSYVYQYDEIECGENPPWKYSPNIPHCWWRDVCQAIKTSWRSLRELFRGEELSLSSQCPPRGPSVVRLTESPLDSLVSSRRATGNRGQRSEVIRQTNILAPRFHKDLFRIKYFSGDVFSTHRPLELEPVYLPLHPIEINLLNKNDQGYWKFSASKANNNKPDNIFCNLAHKL